MILITNLGSAQYVKPGAFSFRRGGPGPDGSFSFDCNGVGQCYYSDGDREPGPGDLVRGIDMWGPFGPAFTDFILKSAVTEDIEGSGLLLEIPDIKIEE